MSLSNCKNLNLDFDTSKTGVCLAFGMKQLELSSQGLMGAIDKYTAVYKPMGKCKIRLKTGEVVLLTEMRENRDALDMIDLPALIFMKWSQGQLYMLIQNVLVIYLNIKQRHVHACYLQKGWVKWKINWEIP